jgi:hypothetical protein
MLSNHVQEIRECYQQAVHCAKQAEAQNDAKVKKQLLVVIGDRLRVRTTLRHF